MGELKTNVLYFGDNLEILRNKEYFPDECVDLIYLDPPFNSKKDYNILFKENSGIESEAQIKAFTDTWHLTQTAQDTYHDIVANGPIKVIKLIGALHDAIGVLITLEPPTEPMKVEAIDAGYYHSSIWDKDYPKMQIFTIEELLKGKAVDMPPQTQTSVTFAKAQKIAQKEGEQLSMQ